MNASLLLAAAVAILFGLEAIPSLAQPTAREVEGASLSDAREAFMRQEIDAARAILGRALERDLAPADRAEARRTLAVLAWRFENDVELGRSHLDRAIEIPADRSAAFAERARLETADGRFGAARRAALDALRTSGSASDSVRAVVRLAEAAVTRVPDDTWPSGSAARRLDEALGHLVPVVDGSPGLLDPARLQVAVALYRDDGPAALAAWRAYYAAALDREGPLPDAHRTLATVLPEWTGPHASPAARRSVVTAFAASGFHDVARLLATDPRVPVEDRVRDDPGVAEIVAYARFVGRVEAVTDAYYRRTARSVGDSDAWLAELTGALRDVWSRLAWEGDPPPFDDDAAVEEIERRFLAEFNVGTTAGTLDLHFGHRAIDDRRRVEQYGHVADLRFVALDGIVSNGFQSWAWDGRAAHGGWATDETIVQIRPGFVGGGLRAWRSLAEAVDARGRGTGRATDLERARRDSCAWLPGLRERMHRDGMTWLRDSLRAEGLDGHALRAAFLRTYDHAQVESSIFAHEGRHAIDRRLLPDEVDPEEREFRAKLSEVAFAPIPRLSLRSINSPDSGDPTPHGRANRRVLCGLAAWIEEHADSIEGFEPSFPALPQLDLLDDAMLREAFRSMDPLASAAG